MTANVLQLDVVLFVAKVCLGEAFEGLFDVVEGDSAVSWRGVEGKLSDDGPAGDEGGVLG